MGKEYTTKLMEHLRTLGSCSFIRPVYTEDETRHAAFQITLDDRVAESLYEHITRSFPVNAGVFAHIEYGRDKNSDDYVFEVVSAYREALDLIKQNNFQNRLKNL